MNYYEHHLGDYDGATAHLSWLEDCAYRRLLCLYYRSEAPIPVDVKQACRLARATSKPERDAVQQILSEFFALEPDGWHNRRCDEDIAAFQETEPDREAKRENAKERQRRSRERRRVLFDSLRTHDIVPAWDTPTKQLDNLLSQAESRARIASVTPPVTAPVTCDDTANQTPGPSPTFQSPIRKVEKAARAARKTELAADFAVSDRVKEWAAEKGFHRLDAQLEAFVSYAKRSGARYVDWDEALMNAIRKDWAEIGAPATEAPWEGAR